MQKFCCEQHRKNFHARSAIRRWRRKHRERYNAYMRKYRGRMSEPMGFTDKSFRNGIHCDMVSVVLQADACLEGRNSAAQSFVRLL